MISALQWISETTPEASSRATLARRVETIVWNFARTWGVTPSVVALMRK